MSGVDMRFSDLPMLSTEEEMRRVHLTTGQYFVKRGGKAHAELTCGHLDDTTLVANPVWRVATSEQCRALRIGWCEADTDFPNTRSARRVPERRRATAHLDGD
jgi:hypothetical protein